MLILGQVKLGLVRIWLEPPKLIFINPRSIILTLSAPDKIFFLYKNVILICSLG